MKYARVYFEEVKLGDALPPLVKGPLQQIQLTRYAGASLDFNPIHQDDEFARAAGMGGVFAHGMLSMGWVGQALTDWAGAGSVRKLGVRFAALVRLKDTVTCTGRVIAKSEKDDVRLVELEVWAENQKGEKVVSPRAATHSRSASRVEGNASAGHGISDGLTHSSTSFSAHGVSAPPVTRAQ